MNQLDQYIERVDSKETFLTFVSMLRDDWEAERREEKVNPSSPYSSGARGWENSTIGDFLDAAHAWADASKEKLPDAPNWKMFAEILYAGKIYE